MKNKLPKYWTVKNDGSQEFQDTVVKYLNETYKQSWTWNWYRYFWYDWSANWNWTNLFDSIENFKNNPTLLTIKQFKKMTTQKEKKVKFKLWEQVAVSDTSEEDAIKKLKTQEHEYYYTWWIDMDWYHITQDSDKDYGVYKYIAKIPKPKTIKIKDVKWNECEIEESKLKTLWFTKI